MNAVLGPLLTGLVSYPFSETLRNQTIGLEAVTLLLVVPLTAVSAALTWRGRQAGPVLALGPATYAAYMMLQYLVGPGYTYYPRVLPLHLGLFVLSAAVALGAWSAVAATALPTTSRPVDRRHATLLLVLAAFVVSRYLSVPAGSWQESAIPPDLTRESGMFWTILTLDLGVVVPLTIWASVLLRRGVPAGRKATYAVLGWFALVPPSVTAMAVVMVVNGDPHGSVLQVLVFSVATVGFWVFAYGASRPLRTHAAGTGPRRRPLLSVRVPPPGGRLLGAPDHRCRRVPVRPGTRPPRSGCGPGR
ncbi:MAG: hypothetical protein Q8R60_05945 [Mycobacteriales bacterium]|nr:hypothetical protein [Mycobacteriales bacterium]